MILAMFLLGILTVSNRFFKQPSKPLDLISSFETNILQYDTGHKFTHHNYIVCFSKFFKDYIGNFQKLQRQFKEESRFKKNTWPLECYIDPTFSR